jgi:multiple sugar transport system permease protein
MAVVTTTAAAPSVVKPPPRRRGRTPRERVRALVRHLVIIAVCVVVLFPVYWMILSTFQPENKTLSFPPPLIPRGFDGSAITKLFHDQPIASWLGHSLYVALITVAITLVLSVFGAYLLGLLAWHGKLLFGFLLLFTQMMPGAMILVPELQFFRTMHWTNNLVMLAVLYAAFSVPLGSWILKASYDNVPREVLDAARVDGCNPLGVLRRILLPLSRAGLVAVAVVAFFGSWNDYLFASAFITDRTKYTGGLGIATFISQQDVPIFELQAAGVVFSLLPVIFYLCVQRYVVRGLTAGAVKG